MIERRDKKFLGSHRTAASDKRCACGRARLDGVAGPVTAASLAGTLAVPLDEIEAALLKLESEGQVMRGRFNPELPEGQTEWCNRRILARIHRLTLGQLRKEIEPVTAAQFQSFLFQWQHLMPGSRLHGADGTLQIFEQLQGYEISAAAWESEVLSRRVARYDPEFLDQLCLSGEVMWARLSPHPAFEAL